MQGLILGALIFGQTGAAVFVSNHPVFGNTYMLPEVVATARRITSGTPSCNAVPDRSGDFGAGPVLTGLFPGCAYATDMEIEDNKVRLNIGHDRYRNAINGDYYVDTNETVEDDVTITGGSATIDGTVDGDLSVMGGEATVNGLIEGEIAVMGGNLRINGTIKEDAAVFGGTVRHKGIIEGDLAAIGGSILLDSGSVVQGDVVTIGGTVERDSGAVVSGEIKSMNLPFERFVPKLSKFFRFHRPDTVASAIVRRLVALGMIIAFYILCLLAILIFPSGIDKINAKLQNEFWISLAIGFAILMAIIPAIVLFAITIVGIPLIFLLPLALMLAGIFGFASLSSVIGRRICESAKWRVTGRIGIFTIGWLALMAITIIAALVHYPLITVISMTMFWIAWIIGQGAVLYAIVKQDRKKETE